MESRDRRPLLAHPADSHNERMMACVYAIKSTATFPATRTWPRRCPLLGYQLSEQLPVSLLCPNVSISAARWHISLSSWLRDYLYIPLGGNRGSARFAYRNVMITMLPAVGHGAAWTFVLGALLGRAPQHREWIRLTRVEMAARAMRSACMAD